MTKDNDIHGQARALLLNHYHGVLSTHSAHVPGFPFGSTVPYCLDRRGHPVILISRLAQHTKNIQADSNVSLFVAQPADDVQAAPRLTCLARAVTATNDNTAARYYAFFPEARAYREELDFDFYALNIEQVSFIAGFAQVHWLKSAEFLRPNPFDSDAESGMVEHMNEDHVDAMIRYCQHANIDLAGAEPAMASVDGEGFHLRIGTRIIRFAFPEPVSTPAQVRAALVAMARRTG